VIRWGVDDPAEIERRPPLRHSGTVYLTVERYTATRSGASTKPASAGGALRRRAEAHRV
jgi:hypothetical protein